MAGGGAGFKGVLLCLTIKITNPNNQKKVP